MTRYRGMLCLLIAIVPATAWAADAYDIAGWAPESSIAVVAWAGADNIQGFAESKLGQLWAEPSVKRFFTRPASTGWAVLREKMTEKFTAERADLLESVLSQVWKRPWVACVFVVKPEKTPSQLGAALIAEAGNDARSKTEALMKWYADAEKRELKHQVLGGVDYAILDPEGTVFFGQQEDRWLLAIGEDAAALVASRPASTFAQSPLQSRARKVLGEARPFNFCCFDTQQLRTGLLRGIAQAVDQKEGLKSLDRNPPIEAICAGVGLGALLISQGIATSSGECAVAVGFDGPDLRGVRYAKANETHPLPFDFLCHAPVDLKRLKSVPGNASVCYLATWNPARVYATTVQTIERSWSEVVEQSKATTKPAGPGDLRQKVRDTVGFDPEKELLAYLGEQIVFWQQPGVGLSANVLICEVRDADALRKKVDELLAKLPKDTLQFRDQEIGKDVLRVLDLSKLGPLGAMMSPCWAITDHELLISTQVGAAADYLRARVATQLTTQPFAENKTICEFLNEHKAEKLGSLGYINEAESFMPSYPQLSMLYPLLVRGVMEEEPRIKFGVFPPPADVEKHLSETLSWTTIDGATRIQHERSGVPIVTDTAELAGTALATSILLPAFAKAREHARRSVCSSNLHGVGIAILTRNNGVPPDLKTLVDSGAITKHTLHCPSSNASEDDLDACYVYIKPATAADPSDVLVYEKPGSHGGEGGNVLFGDGRVQFCQHEGLNELVHRTREKLGTKPAQ